MSAAIRVVVADDHALARAAVRLAFADAEDMEIVGEAEDGRALLALLARTPADVALIDLDMPLLDGFACLDALRRERPGVHALVLTGHAEPAHAERALMLGAAAYLLKTVDPHDLPAAIRLTVGGALRTAGATAPPTVEERCRRTGLSAKEGEILAQLALGRSNREIACALWLSEQTVKFHLRNIYRKLDVANRTEALRFAHDHDLVATAA